MINANTVRAAWKRLCPEKGAATLRVRAASPGPTGWTFTDYALKHVHRQASAKYDPAGEPQADADRATFQVWQDDLDAAGAPAPRKSDLIVQGGVTYEVDREPQGLFSGAACHVCECTKAGPGAAP